MLNKVMIYHSGGCPKCGEKVGKSKDKYSATKNDERMRLYKTQSIIES